MRLRSQFRRGMTLMEIMVSIAIIAGIFGIALPGLGGLFGLERSQMAKQIATTYNFLREEAGLRSVSFRVEYDLDRNSWSVQVGDPNTLVFTDAEARMEFEEQIEDELARYTQREIEEGEAREILEKRGRFDGLEGDRTLPTRVELPGGTVFGWIYTPQYEEPVEAPDEPWDAEMDEESDRRIAHSHVFPDGYMEHTLIYLVDENDPDDGLTLEVEPLTGRVQIHAGEVRPEDRRDWLPDAAPELDL